MSSQESRTGDARLDALAEALEQHFNAQGYSLVLAPLEVTLVLPPESLLETARTLRDHPDFRFEQLIDLCGVDYSTYGQSEWETAQAPNTGFSRAVKRESPLPTQEPRFASVYHLLSLTHNRRLRLKVFLDSQAPMVDSVISIWSAANWFEREAFDLFGILYRGHPDLRRILTDYGFIGHPFRKDFPLSGQVEMHYDPQQRRVVYRPVQIEPRVLVPRVIRSPQSSSDPSENADA